MVTIERIELDGLLYKSERKLRDEVLLKPLGLSVAKFDAMFPGIEERYEHWVALVDDSAGPRVVGCCGLLAHDPKEGEGRLLQVVVDTEHQGAGLGRKLVMAVQERAFNDLGLVRLACHARVEAMPFYGVLGWKSEGEPYVEAGIPHNLLVLNRIPVQLE